MSPHPAMHRDHRRSLRAGQRLGKYKILRRLGEGGFAEVYAALDTIEGSRVALKIPRAELVTPALLEDFRREVRLAARLRHENILPLKNADLIDGRFVATSPLGLESLADRLERRLATHRALKLAEQTLAAVAYAHSHGIVHCDIKPDNLILFPGDELRLTDFGIARVALRTIHASGSGTIGFIAPEQAMGRPSMRSDVFSLGLVIFRMLSGHLPAWPFDWPPTGHRRVRSKVGGDVLAVLERALALQPRRRFADAERMLASFRAARRKRKRAPSTGVSVHRPLPEEPEWKALRQREFTRRFGRKLGPRHACSRCEGPVAEAMRWCPWCGAERKRHEGKVAFPTACPRCHRGLKLDWIYCPWCYGPGFETGANRAYSDRRYRGRCANPACLRKSLMPFMRYCPWCHRKVRKPWKAPHLGHACPRCRWSVAADFWRFCPWCKKKLPR